MNSLQSRINTLPIKSTNSEQKEPLPAACCGRRIEPSSPDPRLEIRDIFAEVVAPITLRPVERLRIEYGAGSDQGAPFTPVEY